MNYEFRIMNYGWNSLRSVEMFLKDTSIYNQSEAFPVIFHSSFFIVA